MTESRPAVGDAAPEPSISAKTNKGSDNGDNEPLPYNGNINAAMLAQDRQAMRRIIAERSGASAGEGPAPSCLQEQGTGSQTSHHESSSSSDPLSGTGTGQSVPSIDQFQCGICHEVLHRPCVAGCGHAFCFWCMFKAMDSFVTSTCAMCRTPFAHFPSVCVPLQHVLNRLFPEDCEQRAAEVAATELENFQARAPVVPPPPPGDLAPAVGADLTCGACGCLALAPAVLNCGHVVCGQGGCLPTLSGVPCPVCATPVPGVPSKCLLLENVLQAVVPDALAARVARGVPTSATAPAPACAAPGPAPDEPDPAPGEGLHQGARVALTGLVAAPALNGRKGVLKDFDEESGRWTVALYGGEEKRVRPRNLQVPSVRDFVHFGCGCDNCGVYPIVGQRWRCTDCPDQMGYDLCGACKTSNRPPAAGRFNQQHLPGHRLERMPEARTWLHDLQDARPDLTLPQILELIDMQMGGDEGAPAPNDEGASGDS